MEHRWGNNESKQGNFRSYSDLVKYLIHGIPFAVISLGFTWFLFFIGLDLIFFDLGLFFGLIGGLLILFLVIIGFSNSLLAEALWDIKPNRSILGFIGQGILLVVMISIFNPILLLVVILLSFSLFLNTINIIISVTLFGYIGGYLGKNIAAAFEPTVARKEELASVHDRHVSCPHCNAKLTVSPNETDESGGINCPGCGTWISIFDRSPAL